MASSSANTRWVLVDDKSSDITYSGSWFERTGNFATYTSWGMPYGDSQHGINGTGSLTFPFVGTRLRVLGTSAIRNISGTVTPSWTCAVDSIDFKATEPFSQSINNWLVCESPSYSAGFHTLSINTESDGEASFWLDHIRYQPLANMSTVLTSPTVIIEQSDPAIQYVSGNWQTLRESAMYTLQAGSVMSLKFRGTKLTWVGWTPSSMPTGQSQGTYSIDGSAPRTFTINGLSSGQNQQYHQRLFETDTLAADVEHTLTVTHNGPSAPLTMDYLLVENGDIIMPAGGSSIPDEGSIAGPSTTPGAGQPSSTVAAAKSAPIGPIVGGAVGGVVLLVLIGLLIWFLRRRKRRQMELELQTANAHFDLTEPQTTQMAPTAPGGRVTIATSFPPAVPQITPFTAIAPNHTGASSMFNSSQTNLIGNGVYSQASLNHSGALVSSIPPSAGGAFESSQTGSQTSSSGWSPVSGGQIGHAPMQFMSSRDEKRRMLPTPPVVPTQAMHQQQHPNAPSVTGTSSSVTGTSSEQPLLPQHQFTPWEGTHPPPPTTQFVHHQDSGIRLNAAGEPQALLPPEPEYFDVPPSYTPR